MVENKITLQDRIRKLLANTSPLNKEDIAYALDIKNKKSLNTTLHILKNRGDVGKSRHTEEYWYHVDNDDTAN